MLLITRKRASPRVFDETDHTPPSEELITISCNDSGRPRTRDACTYKSPRLPLQLMQNLFFLRSVGIKVTKW